MTAVVDYADGGDIENFVNDLLDKYDNDRGLQDRDEMIEAWPSLSKLCMVAMEVRTCVAIRSFCSCICSYDFNRARWITWNKQDDVPCGFRVANNPGKWRAPEEYAYEIEDEEIDVYSAGAPPRIPGHRPPGK